MKTPREISIAGRCCLLLLAILAGSGQSLAADDPPPAKPGAERTDLTERNRLWNDARRLESNDKIDDALAAAKKVLAIDRAKFGENDQRVAITLDYVATLHLARNDFAAAREARRGVQKIWSALPGAAPWRIVDAGLAVADVDVLERLSAPQRAELAKADKAQQSAEQSYRGSKYDQCAAEASAAWQARKTILGADHRRTLVSETLLANCLFAQRKYADAAPLFEHVLKIRTTLLGAEHPDTAASFYNLAKNLESQDQHQAAVTNFQAALAARRKVLGEQSADTQLALASLADAQAALAASHEQAGRWDDARAAGQEVIALYSERYGEQDGRVIDARLALEDVGRLSQLSDAERAELARAEATHLAAWKSYAEESKYDVATAGAKEAWEIRKKVLGSEHRKTVTSENLLANCLYTQNKYEEAEPHYQHFVEVRLRLLGAEHADTATAYNNLANNFSARRRYEDSAANYRSALTIRRKALGNQAPDTLLSLEGLGDALASLATEHEAATRWDVARKVRQEVAALRAERYGEQDSRAVDARLAVKDVDLFARLSAEQLAALVKADEAHQAWESLYYASKYEAATATVKAAWEARKAILGPEHRKTLMSENRLANCYYSLNKYAEADPLYQHVLEVRLKLLGAEHADTATSHSNLANNYSAANRYELAITNYRASLAIRRKILGKTSEDTLETIVTLADALSSWAYTQERAVRWDVARKARAEVLALRTERYGEGDYRVTDARLALEDIDLMAQLKGDKRALLAKADEAAQAAERAYYQESKYSTALPPARAAWEGRKAILGAEHRKTLNSENLLANCHYSLNQYAEAEAIYQHILEVRERLLGGEHPDTASSHANLGKTLSWRDQNEPAVTHQRAALAIRRKALGNPSTDTRQSMADLGDALAVVAKDHEAHDRFDAARSARDEVLALRLERFGAEDGRVADARLALADLDRLTKLSDAERAALLKAEADYQAGAKIYVESSTYDAAIVLLRGSLEVRRKILGTEHFKTLINENVLANCLLGSSKYTEAEPLYAHVLKTRLELLGPDHIDVATSYNNLAKNQYSQQKYAEAATGCRAALVIRRKVLGDQASETLQTIADLADDLAGQAGQEEQAGHLAAARPLREESLALRITRFGADDYRVVDARLAIADLDLLAGLTEQQRTLLLKADETQAAAAKRYIEESKYEASAALAREAFEGRKAILGAENRKTLTSENLLANCLFSDNKYTDAEPLYQHVLDVRTRILGAEHPDTASSQNNLAGNYYWQQRYEEAVAGRRAALAARRKVLGNQAADTRQSISDLSDALALLAAEHEKAARWDAARAARQEVLALRVERYGEHDYRVTDARLALEEVDLLAGLSDDQRALLSKAEELHLATANSYVQESTYIASTAESRKIWQARQTILGAEHRKTLTSENLLANCLYSSEKYAEAESLYQHVADTRLRVLGPDHPDTATSFNNLAKNFYWQRRFQDAVTAHRAALTARRKLLGDQAADTQQVLVDLADALAALATDHEQAARWDAARETREEVVALRTLRYGSEDGRVVDARQAVEDIERLKKLNDADRTKLAQADEAYQTGVKLYTEESRYEAATTVVRAACDGRKEILGAEHRKTLIGENLLANCLYSQNKYAEAEPLYQHVLEVRRRLLGENHADTAVSYNNLANNFDRQRDYEKALVNHRAALATRRKVLGDQALDTRQTLVDLANSLAGLANEHEQSGNWDAARVARKEAIALRTERYGLKDWHVAEARLALEDIDQLSSLGKADQERVAVADETHRAAAAAHANDSDYEGATTKARSAWEERKATLGAENRKTLISENLLADCLFAQAKYAEAETHYQHEIEVQRRRLGTEHPEYATSLNNLANLNKTKGDYVHAEPQYKEVLAIRKKALGEEHPDYASSLNNLAQLYISMGTYDQAEPHLLQALTTRKKVLGRESADYATSLYNLGNFHFAKGNYARAEEIYLEALAIRKKAIGEQHSDYANNLNGLATLYQSMGDYARAEPLLEQALAIRKKLVGEDHPDYASTLSTLADLYYSKGDYAHAEPLYERTLAIRKAALGEEHRDYASSLSSLGTLYRAMGDFARAEPIYQRVLEIRRKALGDQHPDYAASLSNLAGVYQAMGDSRAESLYVQSVELWRRVYGSETQQNPNHPSYATSLHDLADLYRSEKDYARAEPLYWQALEIRKKVLGPQHPDYSLTLNSLGNLYYARGEYDRAESLFQDALKIRQEVLGRDHPDCATCLHGLARLYQSKGDFFQADPQALEALEITARHLELTSAVQSERQQLLMNQAVRAYLDTYLSISAETAPTADQIHGEVLRWKGAVWARQQSLRHWRQTLASDENLSPEQQAQSIAALAELENASRQLATISRAVPPPDRAEEYRLQIAKLSSQIETLQRKLAQLSADFRAALERQQIDSATVSKKLPAGTVLVDLIEYSRCFPSPDAPSKETTQRQLAAFILHPDQTVVRVELGAVPAIRDAVVAWREQFAQEHHDPESDTHAVADPAGTLRRLVWDKLAAALGDAKTVLISPDGVLNQLPWAALPGKKPDTFLLEEGFAFAIVPVPRLLPELLATHARPLDPASGLALLLVGDVDYGATPGVPKEGELVAVRAAPREDDLRSWRKLDATRMEVLAVQDSFSDAGPDERSQSLRKGQATEERVRAMAQKCRYMHFATHGYFADGRRQSSTAAESRADVMSLHPGLLSGLVLAGANQPVDPKCDDGILTALEVEELDLSGMELATLSACQTGLGKAVGGEGALGLQRAFQIAGARTVVASLWLVEDRAGRQLMTDFYENLWQKKLPKIEALRQAQLSMLQKGVERGMVPEDDDKKPKTSKRVPPYYWGMFVLSGDWR